MRRPDQADSKNNLLYKKVRKHGDDGCTTVSNIGFGAETYSGSFIMTGQDLIGRAVPRTDILTGFVRN